MHTYIYMYVYDELTELLSGMIQCALAFREHVCERSFSLTYTFSFHLSHSLALSHFLALSRSLALSLSLSLSRVLSRSLSLSLSLTPTLFFEQALLPGGIQRRIMTTSPKTCSEGSSTGHSTRAPFGVLLVTKPLTRKYGTRVTVKPRLWP